jgi:hypothetical protein
MKELFKALADFQQEVPTIHKGTSGYGYSYADLPAIFDVINPLLKKHGLGFTQTVNGTQLCTTVFHVKSGEVLEGCADIPQNVELKGMNSFQILGSAITYMRRYQLSAMLGLVTDKDTDAGGQQVPTTKTKPQQQPVKQAPKPTPKAERIIVAEGDENYLKIVKGVSTGKATLQQALDKFNISDAVETSLKNAIQSMAIIV